MKRASSNDRYGRRGARLWALLGSTGPIAAAGCLVPDTDYCAFGFGDRACQGKHDSCVLAKREISHDGIDDGCSAEIPDGFVHVRYGLPTMVASPTRRPQDPRSVQGVLRELGYADCGSLEELEASLGPVVDEVAKVRLHLEQRGRVRRAAVALSEDHVDAIRAFDEAIDAWVQGCEGAQTETTGSSTSSGGGEPDPSDTTGGFACDCPSEVPFCDPSTGECVTCDATLYPDGACRNLDSTAPVCFEGACVQCTQAVPEACMGTTPICDDATHTCMPCTAHHDCGEAACNLFTGACLPMDAVLHVGGPASDFSTLATAAASVAEGAQATIVVHGGNYDELVWVDDDRVLAFLAAETGQDPPRWWRSGLFAPQLTVMAGSTVLMDGIELSDNASVSYPGLLVDGGRAWVDRGRIVRNSGGGILAAANAELTLRNCFVGGNVAERDALEVNGATASIVYTTLGAGSNGATALECSGTSAVSVRNSLIVSLSSTDEVVCPGATIEDSVGELDFGVSNTGLGPMNQLWFASYGTGDFHLTVASPELIGTTADWRSGDMRFDIDFDPRPTQDGSFDYAGADVP